MDDTDHYRVLQVDADADLDVIRAAYRVLAAKHHPDAGGSASRMIAINAAWNMLSDPTSRAGYDRERRLRDSGDRWDAYRNQATSTLRSTGTILEYGRYAGWSIPEVAQTDPDFLEWLARAPSGRQYRAEIDEILTHAPAASTAPATGGIALRVSRLGTR